MNDDDNLKKDVDELKMNCEKVKSMTKHIPDIAKLDAEVQILRAKQDKILEELANIKKDLYPVQDIKKIKEYDLDMRNKLSKIDIQSRSIETFWRQIKDIFADINSRYAAIKKIEQLKKSFDTSSKKINKDLGVLKSELKTKANNKKIDKKLKNLKSKIEKIKKKKHGLFK